VLAPGRDGPVRRRRHPWIYSQAVAEVRPSDNPGDLLPVYAASGEVLGWGLHSLDSLISVRMVGFAPHEPPADWLEQRVESAVRLRERLGIDSDAVRLVNAEGDSIPGLVVDRYADTVVVSAHVRGIEALLDRVTAALVRLFPGIRVYVKRDEHFARVEHLGHASGYSVGAGDGTAVITEGGTRLIVDVAQGQKTGYYLDQRANRTLACSFADGRSLLNLFAYTGACSIRAAAAGARRVVSVESSRRAVDLAEQSARLPGNERSSACEWVRGDVLEALTTEDRWDVVVADPPPFARRRADVEAASRAYVSLFERCLGVLAPGGLGFFFSCSGAVDRPGFQHIVSEAALRSGRRARLLRELHADVDHPVAASHPEGEYLKGWMVHVE
jgi:23S rRNA (cytosine1962-C5)-methyltransferase